MAFSIETYALSGSYVVTAVVLVVVVVGIELLQQRRQKAKEST